jgi:hypothetical protein
MAKREETQKIPMSSEMLKNCKRDIAKFGFNHGSYEKFLVSVKAIKEDKTTVLQYRNEQMGEYRDAFLKKNEQTLNDSFFLDRFKILSSNSDGKQYETGYFCPRSFWDFVNDTYQEK